MIRSLAEITNFNFEEIFSMRAIEFFMYLRYLNGSVGGNTYKPRKKRPG